MGKRRACGRSVQQPWQQRWSWVEEGRHGGTRVRRRCCCCCRRRCCSCCLRPPLPLNPPPLPPPFLPCQEEDWRKRHELDRKKITTLVCALCDTRQPVGDHCLACGVSVGVCVGGRGVVGLVGGSRGRGWVGEWGSAAARG